MFSKATEVDGLIEPEIMLPDQCVAIGNLPPERRLMLAVLEEAITRLLRVSSITGGSRSAMAEVDELRAWFASDATSYPFSFICVCQAIAVDPNYMRAGIAAAMDRKMRINAWHFRRDKLRRRKTESSRALVNS